MEYIIKLFARIYIALSLLFVSSCYRKDLNYNQIEHEEYADYIHDEILSEEAIRRDSIQRLYHNMRDSLDEEETCMKYFFVEHGEDSLFIIPGFVLADLFYSKLEGYQYQYFSYKQFKESFLTSKSHRKTLEDWSIHRSKNKNILNDYKELSFNEFFKKYCHIEHGDTFLTTNDATLCFCLDKHSLYCDVLSIEYHPDDKTQVYKRAKIK